MAFYSIIKGLKFESPSLVVDIFHLGCIFDLKIETYSGIAFRILGDIIMPPPGKKMWLPWAQVGTTVGCSDGQLFPGWPRAGSAAHVEDIVVWVDQATSSPRRLSFGVSSGVRRSGLSAHS